ncbi:D-alanyl-D-alanine carboxypeptidase [Streptomyces sp. NPDC020597]|uniref:D-alanyl-D-alanine carboxypeptidase n=1 Tax=unclassified Streptomyces TaxID=2593676 RepID=UPI0037AF69D1
MAGESPDRSKQRESSAEPTSGSAGTVPEARDSREIRDPRVAVARDSDPSPARGGVDTATRVFSVRDLKTEEAEEPGAEGSGADAAGTGSAGAGSAQSEPAGEPEAQEEPEAAEETPAAASDDSEDASDAGTAPAAGQSAGDDAGDGPEGGDETVGEAGTPGEAPEGEEDRLRAAVAQWVATADDESPEDGPAADATDATDPAGEEAGEPADAAPDDDARSERADAKAEERADATAEPEDARPENANRSAESAEPQAEADAGPAAKRAPKWASDAAGTEKPEKPEKPEKSDAEPDVEPDAEDEPEDAKADRTPVDQPTAVFKTPRPKPAVDQPTTMLKLGDVKPRPGGEKADAAAADAPGTADATDGADTAAKTDGADKADDEPGTPAERTSRFVALKPLDEPRPPKPAAQAPADVTAFVPQVGPERTTQQPLPPKPPLDLLAELTNTPPPPPTPLRTLGRRLKIWTPLVLLLVIVFAIVQAMRPLPATALTLTAKDSYTFEGGKTQLPWPNEGQGWMDADGVGTMGSFGKQTPVAIGSVAKTMTAYIIAKDHPMKAGEEGPEIEVDATAAKEGGYDVTLDESTLNTVKAGDKLTEKQALSAVIIPSANNIARLLARWDAGSVEAFVKKMNATARELGMTHTTYTDPSGLKETTVSTAEDQVKLGRAFVKVPALVAISSAASWTDPTGKYWNNYNELPLRIGAIGIKTGSTSAAGGNLLFASRKKVDGKSVTLVGAILGQHKREILKTANVVSQAALVAAEDALTSAKILKKGDVVGYVDDKLGGHTPVVITQDVSAAGWAGMTVKLSFTSGEVPHTAKAGTQVGTLTVGDGTSSAVKVPVALQTDLAEPGFSDKLTRVG